MAAAGRMAVRKVGTTVVAVVGAARPSVEAVAAAANVRGALPEADDPPLDRAVAAWSAARRAHRPYLLHDADPLAAVADAWVDVYDRRGVRGDLDVAISSTLARWRAGSLELPDYYLVDPEELEPTRRHWYLGFLRDTAPARVVPVPGRPEALAAALAHLRAGRWWPDLDRLLDGVEWVVPDRAPEADADDGGSRLLTTGGGGLQPGGPRRNVEPTRAKEVGMAMEQDMQRASQMLDELYRGRDRVPTGEVRQRAGREEFAPDFETYFRHLADGELTRRQVVDSVNNAIRDRGRTEEVGQIPG
jgi:hypothetical protein